MIISRRGQVSLEFIVVFVFIFIISSLLIYVFSYYITNFQEDRANEDRDNFANSILSEFDFFLKNGRAYDRTYLIPKTLLNIYSVNFTPDHSYLNISVIHSGDNENYFYNIDNSINFTYSIVSDPNSKYLGYGNLTIYSSERVDQEVLLI